MKDRVIFKYKHMVIKKYKHGYLLFNSFDRIIGKSIDLYGEWCDEELKLLDKYLNEGDAIIDAGANIGTHTVFFAKKKSRRKEEFMHLSPNEYYFKIFALMFILTG